VIGIRFGLRLIDATGRFLGAQSKGHLRIWSLIFILVCFQMTTTLRPIIAPSKTFLPTEKKFFLAHWFETVNAPNQEKKWNAADADRTGVDWGRHAPPRAGFSAWRRANQCISVVFFPSVPIVVDYA